MQHKTRRALTLDIRGSNARKSSIGALGPEVHPKVVSSNDIDFDDIAVDIAVNDIAVDMNVDAIAVDDIAVDIAVDDIDVDDIAVDGIAVDDIAIDTSNDIDIDLGPRVAPEVLATWEAVLEGCEKETHKAAVSRFLGHLHTDLPHGRLHPPVPPPVPARAFATCRP
jgi:hypothetical protein